MTFTHILFILLFLVAVLFLIALPVWPKTKTWGFGPAFILATVIAAMMMIIFINRM